MQWLSGTFAAQESRQREFTFDDFDALCGLKAAIS